MHWNTTEPASHPKLAGDWAPATNRLQYFTPIKNPRHQRTGAGGMFSGVSGAGRALGTRAVHAGGGGGEPAAAQGHRIERCGTAGRATLPGPAVRSMNCGRGRRKRKVGENGNWAVDAPRGRPRENQGFLPVFLALARLASRDFSRAALLACMNFLAAILSILLAV